MTENPEAELRHQLDQRWAQLEHAGPHGSDDIRTLDVPVTTPDGHVLVGSAHDGRRLLVPLPGDSHRDFKEDRKGVAVQLLKRQVEIDGGLRWYVDLVCRVAPLNDVFDGFIVDALMRIHLHPEKAVGALQRCLADWRALFQSGGQVLSVKQLAGLYGELVLLRRVLEAGGALGLWRGPLKEHHDFSNDHEAVEVKTTLSEDGPSVTIHGARQLEAPDGGGRLLLLHVRVKHLLEGGLSVPDLVESCGELAGRGQVLTRIQSAGYRPAHAEAYENVRFEEVEEDWYEVTEGFSRIVAGSFSDGQIPPGVEKVTYDLDVSLAGSPPISEAAVEEHLSRMISDE